MDDNTRSGLFGRTRGGAASPQNSAGTELIGGMIFLLGCLPAVALLQAWFRGTDLTAVGLGPPARIAATVSDWVGLWPGIVAATALTLVGAMMIVGTLRANPLYAVAGVLLSGVGLAVVASAIAPATLAATGAGGRIGDSTAGELPMAVGVLLGLVVIGAASWLCFASDSGPAAAVDEDGFEPILDDERDAAPRAGIVARMGEGAAGALTAIKERRSRAKGAGLGASNESRRIQPRRQRRASPPATLGDAMARRQTEGVSHDEAAALAPDDKALDYMQSVWKNATESFRQVEPPPPSPYPEDPRLTGEVPEGAKPLDPAAVKTAPEPPQAPAAPKAPAANVVPVAPGISGHAADPFAEGPELDPDVAPFDFVDGPAPAAELPVAPTFEHPAPPLETFERPEGVRPITPAETLAQPTEVTLPPQPTWETPVEEDFADELGAPRPLQTEALEPEVLEPGPPEPELGQIEEVPEAPAARLTPEPPVIEDPEAIPEVDTATGRWPRRDGDELEAEVPEAELEEVEAEAVAEEDEPELPEAEEAEAEEDEEIEYEYVDEDGNPVDPSEIDGEWEAVEEDAEGEEIEEVEASEEEELPEDEDEDEDDPEAEAEEEWEEEEDDESEAELEEADEDDEGEEVEYEYVDEDGNPIDPAELEDGEWEEVEEEDAEEAAEAEEEPAAEADLEAEIEPEIETEPEAESEVVLEPQAPPVAAETPRAASPSLSGDAGRLLEAGLLVVREGRVAVSLLQREFGCEFEEACGLLDELQQEGLIGPYKGGKARDILLTEPEWESRFARS